MRWEMSDKLADYEQAIERYARHDPEILADPYPMFHQLRTEDPVHWSPAFNSWLVTRYSDVVSCSRDPRLSSVRMPVFISQLSESVQEEVLPMARQFSTFLTFVDPPVHTRLRGLVNKALPPRFAEGWRPRIQSIVDSLLDAVQDARRMDLVGDFSAQLPAIVIADVVGVPPEDRVRFKLWADDIAAFVGGSFLPERALAAQRSMSEMRDYANDMVTRRRRDPGDDFISSMLAAGEEDGKLDAEELFSLIITLLVAGHETTKDLIANGTLALLKHPNQMQKLKDDPSLIANAVEEFLRYESPLQRTDRVAAEDLEICGKVIGKGQFVKLLLGAANRDPAQFPDPDRLDIERHHNRQVAFGYGIHFCVGAPLARVEGQIALSSILQRWPELRLESDGALEYQPNLALRALKSLPVAF